MVDVIEAKDDGLDVPVFGDRLEGRLKSVGGGKVKLAGDADDPDFVMGLLFGADDNEAPLRVEGVFDEVGRGGFAQESGDRDHDADEKSHVEAED